MQKQKNDFGVAAKAASSSSRVDRDLRLGNYNLAVGAENRRKRQNAKPKKMIFAVSAKSASSAEL
jgi:hypothetical protein